MSAVAGWGLLTRIALRRDRVLLPGWIAALGAFVVLSATSVLALYPDAASRDTTAATLNASPALLALYGPLPEPVTVGALAMWKPGGTGVLVVAALMIITVVRHTRLDEEEGRGELVGAGAVGRAAPVAAALAVSVLAGLALAVVTATALAASGLPLTGSLLSGAGWAAAGLVLSAAAALAAQVTRSARAARGGAFAVLGVAFALRAAGDAAGLPWLTALSPLGWVQSIEAFAGNRWALVVPALVVAVVLAASAVAVAARRDLGAGVWTERPGPATAAPGLRGGFGVAWRLQRGVLAAWAVGFVLLGALLGSVAGQVDGLLASAQVRDAVLRLGGTGALVDAFLAADLGVLGILAGAYTVGAVLRVAEEERAGRADPLLAAGVGRLSWAGSHLVVAAAGTAALLVVGGTACGLAAGPATGGGAGGTAATVGRLVVAAAAHVPAAWVAGAVAALLLGLAPRAAGLAWLGYAGFAMLTELGPFLSTPSWVVDLSPFTHSPRLPGPDPALAPLVWLVALAALGVAAGAVGLRVRDVGA